MINKLIGRVFVQAPSFEIGKSSYHFDSIDDVYIRFDKWGVDLPHKKSFSNTKFNLGNRSFIGLIDWTLEGGYRGEVWWLYFMVFNEDYSAIDRGFVVLDGSKVHNFASDLNYVAFSPFGNHKRNARSKHATTDDLENTFDQLQDSADQLNEINELRRALLAKNRIPFRTINSDKFFDSIVKIDEYAGLFLSDSNDSSSKIKKKFQSYVTGSIASFRREVVDGCGLLEFKNDLATMEVCGLIIALLLFHMNERGVEKNVSTRVMLEGIKATLGFKTDSQISQVGSVLIKIIESYDLNHDENFSWIISSFLVRLIGSNLAGKLELDYNEIINEHMDLVHDFLPIVTPRVRNFVERSLVDSVVLVNDVLGARW